MKHPLRTAAENTLVAIGRAAARSRQLGVVTRAATWCVLQGAQNAHYYDVRRNGEAWLVGRLAGQLRGRTVIDAGASIGDWSALVLESSPDASILAIEMIPDNAAKLRARLGQQITIVESALSSENGTATAHKIVGHGRWGGRLLLQHSSRPSTTISVPLRTGDSLQASNVAMIKIDVEGFDIPVLRGFGATIARERPVLQFEYSRLYIGSRHFLKDAYDVLEPLGYRLGRLMPRRVDFARYSLRQENFLTNNYVAVPEEHQALPLLL